MSASLIKSNGEDVQSFALFNLPEDDGDILALGTPMEAVTGVMNTDPETEAGRIIDAAHARALQIEREAQTRAEEEIRIKVVEEISRVIDPWREELQNSLEDLSRLRSDMVRQTEGQIVKLALEIARKVIHKEVTTNQEIAVNLTRVALAHIPNRTAATVHLHPDDLAYFETKLDQIESGHALTLIADRSVGHGGCVVQTEMGEVDATIEQQFAQIESALLET